ncbi:tyrosine-type recombinase/integrase, partial [Acetobacter oeni]|uniref:tyrosine-type recombinase/integrase n=1 Tax=Acetobacter oeni TaxID=304077 RepID=UPI001F54C49E
MDALRLIGIQQIEPRVIGGFVEWLLDTKGLAVKTAQSRVSPLKVFWQWCIRKHMIPGPNPWTGATEGMKKQAQRGDRGHWGGRGQETGRHHNQRRERREFSEGELTKLLNTDPDEGRRWAWGPAIRDLMRLAVLTGARENELCSLTVRHILNREPGSVGGTHLWGMAVMDEEAKTASSVRRIPLHPLARTIIERRLSQTDGSPDAPLFPECKPGGPDGKRGYYFAKRFTTFRRAVLGAEESDGWVTFHSFRKNFATYMQRASVAGVSDCQLSV